MRKIQRHKEKFTMKDFLNWVTLLAVIVVIIFFILGMVLTRTTGGVVVKGDPRFTLIAIALGVTLIIANSNRGE